MNIMGNYSAFEYEYGPEGCFGGSFRTLLATFLHPFISIVGVLLSVISLHALSRSVVSVVGISVRKVYSLPVYTLLRAISSNAIVFFATIFPHSIYYCSSHYLEACGPNKGALGYALAHMVFTISVYLNDVSHWANFVLIACYGAERCLVLTGRSKSFNNITAIYCTFFAYLFAMAKRYLVSKQYEIEKKEDGTWIVEIVDHPAFIRFQSIYRDIISFIIALIALLCYLYICNWLLCVAPGLTKSASGRGLIQQSMTYRQYTLTRFYVAIASLFILHLIISVAYYALRYVYVPTSLSAACDVLETMTEVNNLAMELAELSAIIMGFVVHNGYKRQKVRFSKLPVLAGAS